MTPASPLTPWQTDLWLAERLLAPGTALLISTRLQAPAPFSAEQVRAAADAVLRAHPLLAAAVDESGGIPQLVHRPGSVEVRAVQAPRESALDALLSAALEPIDLERSLVRATLGTAAREGTALFQLDAHHLVFDGISQRLLFERFGAALGGADLPGDGGAYFAYAHALAAADAPLSPAARARVGATARHLQDVPQGTLAAAGRLRHATLRVAGEHHAGWLAACARAGCKPAALAVAVVLRALAACEPVPLLAITADARPREHAATLGDFANVLPMLFDAADAGGGGAAVAAAERELAVVRALRTEPVWNALPGAARSAAIDVAAITYRSFAPRVLGAGVRVNPFLPNRHAKRRLTFQILDGAGALAFRLESDALRVSDEGFARLLAAFGEVLEADGIAHELELPEVDQMKANA